MAPEKKNVINVFSNDKMLELTKHCDFSSVQPKEKTE
jgi:hypothetical protein